MKYIKWLKESLTQQSTKAIKHSEKQNRIALRVFCARGKWGKPTRQPRSIIPIRRNQLRKVEIPSTKIHKLSDYTVYWINNSDGQCIQGSCENTESTVATTDGLPV
jgi:hypothetical protein